MPPLAARRPSLPLLLGTALAYAVAGWLAVRLTARPEIVSPLFPSAGIALAAVLLYGNRLALAAGLGSLLLNLLLGWEHGYAGTQWLAPFAIAVGATLQARLGAALVRRYVGFPSTLEQVGTILRFLLLGCLAGCLLNPSWSVGWLLGLGILPKAEAPFAWWNWWIGDAMGTVIAAPILIALLSPRSADWDRRRLGIVLPFLLAGFFMTLALLQATSREVDNLYAQFERDTRVQAQLLRSRFTEQITVLRSVERHLTTSPEVSRDSFHMFTAPWFEHYPGMAVIGWAELTSAASLPALERRMLVEHPQFRLYDRGSRDTEPHTPASADEYLPVLYAEPTPFNTRAVGLNLLSIAPASQAIANTRLNGEPQASAALRLVQDPEQKLSVVVYQGVFQRPKFSRPRFVGVVYTAFRLDDTLANLVAALPAGVALCLTDRTVIASPQHLAGAPGCGTAAPGSPFVYETLFPFAGRQWEIRFTASPDYLATHRSWEPWTLLLGALLLMTLLGAFLLITTAHAQRIHLLVEQRTAELSQAKTVLETNRASLAYAQQIARLGSWSWEANAVPDMIWSDEMYRILGLEPGQAPPTLELLASRFLPDERAGWEATLAELRAGRASTTLDTRITDAEGRIRLVHLEIEARHRNDVLVKLLGTLQDVTSSRETEAHIHYLAHYDTLTGLPNRSLLRDRVNQSLAAAQRQSHPMALLFIDLDRFKKVNDTLGHPIGDRLLGVAAERLRSCIRDEDTMARIGGDEFMLLLPHIDFPAQAAIVARKIVEQFSQPFIIDQHELTVTASIGIAVFPEDGTDFDTLVKHADTAMFSAKESGRNTFQFFTAEMDARAYERLLMENQLRRAVERNELALYYQPQIAAGSGRIIGAEALVRWRHPEKGLVPPAQFIPLAEESGLIVELGNWVLAEACRQQVAWRKSGLPVPRIAVNISALQFRRSGFVTLVRRTLTQTGADPAGLELELTESALMEPTGDIERQLASLKELGLSLSLDDFGTGYSNLAYLKRYPLDQLKIDRSFIQDLPGDAEDAAITAATLSLGRSLGLTVVAEGVETPAQRDFVAGIGCHVMQGYLFSPPLPVSEFETFVTEYAASRTPTGKTA
ncbi:EAL domain-containing protein [Oryzomicrobium sp.]|uniref:EAL domain-containing protein n=1 Tax=Oryzomicrobium sp. TaxID=1911578 RepID=UPI0025E14B9A|nr:EAL domain-containing protein [Oryzomicrobium sp.]MCE1242385.1 EAL domain-containing protein [Oryzomicrobium sp.]